LTKKEDASREEGRTQLRRKKEPLALSEHGGNREKGLHAVTFFERIGMFKRY